MGVDIHHQMLVIIQHWPLVANVTATRGHFPQEYKPHLARDGIPHDPADAFLRTPIDGIPKELDDEMAGDLAKGKG